MLAASPTFPRPNQSPTGTLPVGMSSSSLNFQVLTFNSVSLSPFPATLTNSLQTTEKPATLSPAFATLRTQDLKPFRMNTYKKEGRGARLVSWFPYDSTWSKNRGAFRNFVACSKPYASLIKTGSLHARPKNEMPTGKP